MELMKLGVIILFFGLTLSPLVGLLLLLNRRDRRQARVLGTVLEQLSSPDLRGRVAARVRSGLLSPKSVVTVDVAGCSREEIWDIMTRLSQRLSPQIRLEVSGPQDRCFLATFTVETLGWRPPLRPPQPSLATG